jgi:hypothetical protein
MEKAEFTLRYFYCAAAGGLFLQIDGRHYRLDGLCVRRFA